MTEVIYEVPTSHHGLVFLTVNFDLDRSKNPAKNERNMSGS